MKNLVKKTSLLLLFLALTAGMLLYPRRSLFYALTGLTLWYEKMIPALLPFMILSNLLIGLRLTDSFVVFLKPILGRLFSLNGHGVYAVFVGFLCGFPMGAKVTADLYRKRLISKKDAQNLLCFSNNIGPIYFTSFVLPLLQVKNTGTLFFGMYGLPFLYGLFLCNFCRFSKLTIFKCFAKKQPILLHAAILPDEKAPGLLDILDDSIMSALTGIAKLGGYMVLFNLLNLLPDFLLAQSQTIHTFFSKLPVPLPYFTACINCLLEITSGISRTNGHFPFLVLVLLPFGGFSCIAQTYSIIKGTDLSIKRYVLHKSLLSLISAFYYILVL